MRPSSAAPLLSASSPKGSPRPSSPTPQLPVNPPTPQLPSNPTPQLPVKVFLKKESNKKLGKSTVSWSKAYSFGWTSNGCVVKNDKQKTKYEFTYNDVYVLLLDNDASLPLIGTLDQLKSQISNFQDVLFFTLHNQNEPKIVATFAILSEDFSTLYSCLLTGKDQLSENLEEGHVRCSVLEASDLPICDLSSSDPYFQVYWANAEKKLVGKKATTNVIKKTLNPKWGKQFFTLQCPSDAKYLVFHAFDQDDIGKDDEMGALYLDITTIPLDYKFARWFSLPCEDSKSAEIKIELVFKDKIGGRGVPVPDDIKNRQKKLSESQHKVRKAETKMLLKKHREGLDVMPGGELNLSCRFSPEIGLWKSRITLTVNAGRGLIAKDTGGTSDPYCFVFLGKQKPKNCPKTPTIKKTLQPQWKEGNNFSFEFPLGENFEASEDLITILLFDEDTFVDESLGYILLHVQGLCYDWKNEWYKISYVPETIPVMSDNAMGKKLRDDGWAPKYPIFLVPGFASSALTCTESCHKGWQGKRIWLDINNLLGSKVDDLKSSSTSSSKLKKSTKATRKEQAQTLIDNAKSQVTIGIEAVEEGLGEVEEDVKEIAGFKSKWVEHLCLLEDCKTDPTGIKVRPVPSFDGCMYLQEGKVGKALAYVLGPLVENLESLGYVKNDDMFAFPYDWRLPPVELQIRDQYYTKLQNQITETVKAKGLPVVVIGHSMGNRTLQYFFNFVKAQSGGQEWLDTHIHRMIACGAPWLGAPKMCRALVTGERMGLDALLTGKDSISFARRVGTTMFLMPEGLSHYHENMKLAKLNVDTPSFIFVNGETKQKQQPFFVPSKTGKKEYHAMAYDDVLKEVGAEQLITNFDKYYMKDPLFGGQTRETLKILDPIPIKRLINVYGVNVNTEKYYFYKSPGIGKQWKLDDDCTAEIEAHERVGGMVFETEETPQRNLIDSGAASEELTKRSGDGTVTYESLSYPNFAWKGCFEEFKSFEINHAAHRGSVSTARFFELVVQYCCQKSATSTKISSNVESKVGSELILNANSATKKIVTKSNMDSLAKKFAKKGDSADTLLELKKLWSALDQDNSGSLDLIEAATFFGRLYDEWFDSAAKKEKNKAGFAQKRQEKIDGWIALFDEDKSGTIEWSEFSSSMMKIMSEGR